jgi:hypothetical protein
MVHYAPYSVYFLDPWEWHKDYNTLSLLSQQS